MSTLPLGSQTWFATYLWWVGWHRDDSVRHQQGLGKFVEKGSLNIRPDANTAHKHLVLYFVSPWRVAIIVKHTTWENPEKLDRKVNGPTPLTAVGQHAMQLPLNKGL
jgi:hypothetical protein